MHDGRYAFNQKSRFLNLAATHLFINHYTMLINDLDQVEIHESKFDRKSAQKNTEKDINE